ncbi:hypothetical protein CSQ87_10170 [Bifidobacterium simiarum]|uniref:DUF3073 domain-containing protein n=1 Tax=Bifidobacterium simiarum TaxID=2045441 RepID=A0A2M9HCB0_9BIFI|nr:hypothetical protein CSQ87_10170 [Bifidobacterium simiarum]
MGRGRQKAKQTRIARKLKYLTTDTDYDELAKELSSQDEVTPSAADPFASIESRLHGDDHATSMADTASSEDLDEYAQWAAEAAKKAEEQPVVKAPVRRKPIPMPMPSALKKPMPKPAPSVAAKSDEDHSAESTDETEAAKPAKKTVRRSSASGKTAAGKTTAKTTAGKTAPRKTAAKKKSSAAKSE